MTSGVDKITGKSHKFIDRTWNKNGRLTYIEFVGISKCRQTLWRALCECGNYAIVSRVDTKSCGCLRKEKAVETRRKAAMSPELKREKELLNRKKQKERRKITPHMNMQARLSRLHRHALAKVNAIKTSPTFEALGYSVDEFVSHIEKQFIDGMNWENMHLWQIDHIIPTIGITGGAGERNQDDE